jgi:hypothetical protein
MGKFDRGSGSFNSRQSILTLADNVKDFINMLNKAFSVGFEAYVFEDDMFSKGVEFTDFRLSIKVYDNGLIKVKSMVDGVDDTELDKLKQVYYNYICYLDIVYPDYCL